MSFKTCIVIIISLLLQAQNVYADDLDDAIDWMSKGDFAKAYCVMRPLAESGNAEAQYNIGWMYHNGYGLRIDNQQALNWWKKAYKQGYTDASFSIGMLYSLGEGNVQKDAGKAIDYYLVAAKNGQDDAVWILKSMLMKNEPALKGRAHEIVKRYGKLLGKKRRVKVKELNARSSASTKSEIIARLKKGTTVLELSKKNHWSQVFVIGSKEIELSVWVSNNYLD